MTRPTKEEWDRAKAILKQVLNLDDIKEEAQKLLETELAEIKIVRKYNENANHVNLHKERYPVGSKIIVVTV